jgi:cytochrome c
MVTSLFIALQSVTPVPKDLPLPLPLPEWLLVAILVVSFLVHILFVNLMVGGSILTLWSQIKGLKNKEYDILAHEIATTITVNKSMAVVMGIAPLLSINVLYTLYFYSANALTGLMWIAVIPLVTVAFLLTYLHKYTWKLLENNKPVHI